MATNDEFHKEYLAATRRAKEMQATHPMAVAAKYKKRVNRVVISLSSRVDVMFSPADVEGLELATPSQLSEIEVTPSGFGLYFPQMDADINVLNLLEGVLGSRRWMASRLGAQGGKSAAPAKPPLPAQTERSVVAPASWQTSPS